MKYKSTTGFYSDGDGTQIPFYFKISIFHNVEVLRRNNINLIFKQAINGSALPSTGWTPFGGCKFDWTTNGSKYKYTSNSIYDIFAHYGYAYSKDKCRKPHSLILANLICPKIDYQSYGRINLVLVLMKQLKLLYQLAWVEVATHQQMETHEASNIVGSLRRQKIQVEFNE